MSDSPVFNQVNIVARDWEASLAFYRLLGLDLGRGLEYPLGYGRHVAISTSVANTTVEFDSRPMVRAYADDAVASSSAILGLAFASAEARMPRAPACPPPGTR
jgi:hypothetical protein